MDHKQRNKLRKLCIAVAGLPAVQRGEFDQLCDQVLKPALEQFAAQGIYYGLLVRHGHSKPRAPAAWLVELAFKGRDPLHLAFVAEGGSVVLQLDGQPLPRPWSKRIRDLDAAAVVAALLQVLRRSLSETITGDEHQHGIETDAGPRASKH